MTIPRDFRDLLAAFADEAVEYLLIGGYAVALHGRPRFTKDLDLWVCPEPANLSRVRRALESFGAPAEMVAQLESAAPLDVLWMGAPPVRIDVVKGVPGGDFPRAWATHVEVDWEGFRVSVVGKEELIALKRASGRPQDVIDADLLESVDER